MRSLLVTLRPLLAGTVLAGSAILEGQEFIDGVVPPATVTHVPDTPVRNAIDHGNHVILSPRTSGSTNVRPTGYSTVTQSVIRQWWEPSPPLPQPQPGMPWLIS